MSARVLLVGETWTSLSVHVKGWDQFWSAEHARGADAFVAALESADIQVDWMPAELAPERFPLSAEELGGVDVVVLSDIGARSLLLHPDVWRHGKPVPNRLAMLGEWTRAGGGLAMCGGYLSFAGSGGSAAYGGTALEEILPVQIDRLDDRIECPEGVAIAHAGQAGPAGGHPLARFFTSPWPVFLGYNRVRLRPGASLVATIKGDPFVATADSGAGRSLVWTSDIGPHWCPSSVLDDDRFGAFWRAAVAYLAGG